MVGLNNSDIHQRLKEFGANEIQREKVRPIGPLFIDQFKSPLVLILFFAFFISLILNKHIEAIAIGSILFINALIGFFQEYRAETVIAALRKMTAPRAKVFRNGKQSIVLARDVVPGDLLILESGDVVAADAKIIEASSLQINEAILTGESMPVLKAPHKNKGVANPASLVERSDEVFMGTSVSTGTATVEVTATGMKTELGKIAHLITTAQTDLTPLQRQLAEVGKSLLYICLVVVAIVVVVGLLRGMSWLDLLIYSVSLAVAAVPEGMPAIVTVALAMGVQRLAAQKALIRKLPSVETLGSVSIICTDKTGTLTTGNMRVREMWSAEDKTEVKTEGKIDEELIRAAAACCDAELRVDDLSASTGDPTEIAILIAAKEKGMSKENIERNNPRVSTIPFESERRRMSVFRQDGVNYVKGAIESIAPLCLQDKQMVDEAYKVASKMTAQGLRVLAVAIGQDAKEENLHFLGLLAIADPPRKEAKAAIFEARSAGIIPIMITGDNPQTAAAIAQELGLVLEGEKLESRVHARATPEDKLKLVRHWKQQGAIVAMTGDGVNDAPALREAHIGIAMGVAGTEVTRQAADLVLADDNFATIVAAVREGRGIFQNIRKSILYLLTGNLAEVALVVGAIILGLPLPLLAAHLLWINLVTDALPALTLLADPLSPDLMKNPPRSPSEHIIGKREWLQIIVVGLLEAVTFLGLFWYVLKAHNTVMARNYLFTGFVFSQLFRSFGARSAKLVFWKVGFLNNLWLLGVIFFTGLIQLALHYFSFSQKIFGLIPLSASDILFILPFSLVAISLVELKKIGAKLGNLSSF